MEARTADYYAVDEQGRVTCRLCPHECRLRSGQSGICRVRYNNEGKLHTITYGQISSLALDPIEKKPLYHFYPGTQILSLGSFGCNLSCPWCQNHHIACTVPPTRYLEADEVVELGLQAKEHGSVGLAYTYNEPTMAYEFVLACARKAKVQGLKNVLVTNGYISPEPLAALLEVTDALNIDLKGFTPQFYRHHCKGTLEPVWDSIELAATLSHVEVTTLIIPGLNDDASVIREAACRLSQISPNIPWHLSAFHPAHRFQSREATPAATLIKLKAIAQEYMNYVYLGNIPNDDNDTRCPACGNILVLRQNYSARVSAGNDKCCSVCGRAVDIVW